MHTIESRNNPKIKALAALQKSKGRSESGLTLAEGPHLVREALQSNIKVESVIVAAGALENNEIAELINSAEKAELNILKVSADCYAKISGLKSPEGIAASIPCPSCDLQSLLGENSRLVVAAGVQDPGNGGAILRVAEAAGASGCVFLGSVDTAHPRFLRATMGSCFRIPATATSEKEFLNAAKAKNLRLLAAVPRNAVDYTKADYTPPVAICLGGEGEGLSEKFIGESDSGITIPMHGKVESLNVAVSAGIILYQATKKWNQG